MSGSVTRTDPASLWVPQPDEVVQLREVGTDRTYALPINGDGDWMIGSAVDCALRLVDPLAYVSRNHARLSRHGNTWTLTDMGSKNGLWLDDARCHSITIHPGVEIRIGSLRFIAESPRLIDVRTYLRRILGWSERALAAVDDALHMVRDMISRRAPLRLQGEGDLVALARSLHRRAVGEHAPFVVSDPRRVRAAATARSPENRIDIVEAVLAASGGALCMWTTRLPVGLDSVRDELRGLRLILCTPVDEDAVPSMLTTSAISVTPLSKRRTELDRLIDEYTIDACTLLDVPVSLLCAEDRAWLWSQRPRSLPEIEAAALRMVALRELGSINRAAARLGISGVAFSRWLSRRR